MSRLIQGICQNLGTPALGTKMTLVGVNICNTQSQSTPLTIELCKSDLSYIRQGRLLCNGWISLLLLQRLNSNMVVHLSTAWFTDVEGAFVCPRPLMRVDLTDENPTAKDNIDDTLTPLNHFSEPKVKADRE